MKAIMSLPKSLRSSKTETDWKLEIADAAIQWRNGKITATALAGIINEFLELPSQKYIITKHAIERYRTRRQLKGATDEAIRKDIGIRLNQAKEKTLKNEWMIFALLNHDLKEARYFLWQDWMFVVVEDRVVTCYKKQADRWK